MNNQVLSAEQMQELIDMGIDVSKASMYWVESFYFDEKNNNERIIMQSVSLIPTTDAIPTFTLYDILNLFTYYTLTVKGFFVKLSAMVDLDEEHTIFGTSEIQVAFEMLKWCKINNKL